MKKKILVTGADGFIGSHLVELLIVPNFTVKAFVNTILLELGDGLNIPTKILKMN